MKKTINKPLAELLNRVFEDDQRVRNFDHVVKKYGWKSKEMDSVNRQITFVDSLNAIKVKKIITDHGWLGPEVVGERGALAIFLAIQHSDIATRENYVKMMRKAVKKGTANPQHLALLEDRILVQSGKKQIYGSQTKFNEKTEKVEFHPIEDKKNVDKRRAAIGLPSMKYYAALLDIEYSQPDKY